MTPGSFADSVSNVLASSLVHSTVGIEPETSSHHNHDTLNHNFPSQLTRRKLPSIPTQSQERLGILQVGIETSIQSIDSPMILRQDFTSPPPRSSPPLLREDLSSHDNIPLNRDAFSYAIAADIDRGLARSILAKPLETPNPGQTRTLEEYQEITRQGLFEQTLRSIHHKD